LTACLVAWEVSDSTAFVALGIPIISYRVDTSLKKGIIILMCIVLFFLDKKKNQKKSRTTTSSGFQPPSPKEKGSGCSFISVHLSSQRHPMCSWLILIAGWLCFV